MTDCTCNCPPEFASDPNEHFQSCPASSAGATTPPDCECGHPKRDHNFNHHDCLATVNNGRDYCPCTGYRPAASPTGAEPAPTTSEYRPPHWPALEGVWRCEHCGLTGPATSQLDADDRHALAATNCAGVGRMLMLQAPPTGADQGEVEGPWDADARAHVATLRSVGQHGAADFIILAASAIRRMGFGAEQVTRSLREAEARATESEEMHRYSTKVQQRRWERMRAALGDDDRKLGMDLTIDALIDKLRTAEARAERLEADIKAAHAAGYATGQQHERERLEAELTDAREFGRIQMEGFNDINAQFQEQGDELDALRSRFQQARGRASAIASEYRLRAAETDFDAKYANVCAATAAEQVVALLDDALSASLSEKPDA